MNRLEKSTLVDGIDKRFCSAESVFVIENFNLNAFECQNFRKKLRLIGGELKIVKNSLLKKLAEKNKLSFCLKDFYKRQISLIFVNEGTTEIASMVNNFEFKKKKDMSVLGGVFLGNFFDGERFNEISKIPSREVLLIQLCYVLRLPILKFVMILKKVNEKNK
jgi:large subunit ribosomal protein L10